MHFHVVKTLKLKASYALSVKSHSVFVFVFFSFVMAI